MIVIINLDACRYEVEFIHKIGVGVMNWDAIRVVNLKELPRGGSHRPRRFARRMTWSYRWEKPPGRIARRAIARALTEI